MLASSPDDAQQTATAEGASEETSEAAAAAEESPLDIEEPEDQDSLAESDQATEDETPAEEDAGGEEEGEEEEAEEDAGASDELLARARQHGMTDEEIDAVGSAANLTKFVGMMDSTQAARAEVSGGGEEKEEGKAKAADEEKGEEEAGKQFEPYEVTLDPATFDPEIVQTLKDMSAHQAQNLGRLQETVDALHAVLNDGQRQAFTAWFDTQIEGLGEEYVSLVGKGDCTEVERESPEYQNRLKLLDQMDTIEVGRAKVGLPVLDRAKLFQEAVASVFAKESDALARKKIAGTLKRRSGQFLQRSTSRKGKDTLTPTQRATKNVAEKLKEFGQGEEPEEDGL